MSSEENPVRVERRGPVGILTIDRPARLNALSRPTLYALGEGGRELTADASIKVIVVTGAGDKAFCAGADLKERKDMTSEDIREQVGLYRSELGVLDHSEKPVVAAINGAALGGGLELALLCDLRVATRTAKLGLPETSLGIIPGSGGTQRLARVVGEGRAVEMICLARRIDAEQAERWGLVNHVVAEDADLLEATIAYVAPIAEGAPIAQAAALEAIRASFDVPLDRGLELERVYYDQTLRSNDRLEALAAFAEKRKPVYRGE